MMKRTSIFILLYSSCLLGDCPTLLEKLKAHFFLNENTKTEVATAFYNKFPGLKNHYENLLNLEFLYLETTMIKSKQAGGGVTIHDKTLSFHMAWLPSWSGGVKDGLASFRISVYNEDYNLKDLNRQKFQEILYEKTQEMGLKLSDSSNTFMEKVGNDYQAEVKIEADINTELDRAMQTFLDLQRDFTQNPNLFKN